MRSALDGDQVAYRTLLTSIAPHVRARARHILLRAGAGSAEAEDVVQETLLAVHLKRSTWDPSRPFIPWLDAVARHKVIDSLRRRGKRTDVELDTVADKLAVAGDDGADGLDVATVLAALDRRHRTIVEGMSLEGRSAAEVGAELNMSEGAVRVALHRALKLLAAKFNEPPK